MAEGWYKKIAFAIRQLLFTMWFPYIACINLKVWIVGKKNIVCGWIVGKKNCMWTGLCQCS